MVREQRAKWQMVVVSLLWMVASAAPVSAAECDYCGWPWGPACQTVEVARERGVRYVYTGPAIDHTDECSDIEAGDTKTVTYGCKIGSNEPL